MTLFLFAVAVTNFGVCHAQLGTGIYTIQQQSNMRYVDAEEGEPFNVVTRESQESSPTQRFTQRWLIMEVEKDSYTIQQVSSMRFVDAFDSGDFNVVTRESQKDVPGQQFTQQWVIKFDAVERSYTIQQQSTMRYVDAFEEDTFQMVTRVSQDNIPGQKRTQRWIISAVSEGTSELVEAGWYPTLGWSAACGVVGVLAGAAVASFALRSQRQSSDAKRFALIEDA